MKEERFDTVGGLTAPVQIYESVDEAEKIMPGGLLKQANSNMVYRQVLPVVREAICNLVEEKTGIPRESKVISKTKTGKDITQWEADKKYVDRVLSQLVKEGKKTEQDENFTEFQGELDTLCRNYQDEDDKKNNVPPSPLAVDLKGATRKAPEPKRLAAKYKITAAGVIALGNVDNVNVNVLSKINKTFTASGDSTKMFTGETTKPDGTKVPFNVSDKDAESLGWLIKEYQSWKETQELNTLVV